ncbi:MAG: hypothetical protein JOZ10_05905 [Acidobacteria bacterium]|nr:hypothetical protein [Acidobacteriota bacterium]MBV9437425.1 hypothetical protein [Acidobacteriota bacterium]
MSLRIRFRFDGRCSRHPRYNPEKDGRPAHPKCPGCESLYVIALYCGIARRRAAKGDGIIVSNRETIAQPDVADTKLDESPAADELSD